MSARSPSDGAMCLTMPACRRLALLLRICARRDLPADPGRKASILLPRDDNGACKVSGRELRGRRIAENASPAEPFVLDYRQARLHMARGLSLGTVMLKNISGLLVLSVALMCAMPAFADPSVEDIYNAADAGHLGEAQQMLDQVLQDHPHSARAHWMAAEIYARSSNFDRARQELSTAQQLAPGLPFVRPEAVLQLQQQLGKTQTTQRPAPASQVAPHYVHTHPVFPLRTILFVIGAIIVVWLILRPRTP